MPDPAARTPVAPQPVQVYSPPPGTVVVVQQQQQQRRRGPVAIDISLFFAALLLSFLQWLVFTGAYTDLNSSNPQVDDARATALGSIMVGLVVGGLALLIAFRRRGHLVPTAIGGVFGLVMGGTLASSLEGSFGIGGELGWLLIEGILFVIMLVPFILFLVFVFGSHERVGWGLGVGLILFHALAYLTLASYLSANAEELGEAAKAANTAGMEGVALLLALGLTVLARRAARRP